MEKNTVGTKRPTNPMSKRLRWKLAIFLNHFRRFCWSDLAMFALYHNRDEYRLRDLGDARQTCGKGDDFDRNGCCYCGKFRVDPQGDPS